MPRLLPAFADSTGGTQFWTQNAAIGAITVPAATGTPTPTYAATGVPAGINFNTTTRGFSAALQAAAGSGTITVTATNSAGSATWTVAYITAAALTAPSFFDNTGDAQTWTVGTAITQVNVPAPSGNPLPAYSVVGALPGGIAFNTAQGVISGTPTGTGSGTIRIRATNSQGSADWTVAYTTSAAQVGPSFTDNTGNAQNWTQNITITNITVPAASGNPTPTYEVVGTPPAGIAFNTTTRVISGTPTVAGSGTIRIRASNSVDTADWTVAYTVALSTAEPEFADNTGNAQTWAAGTAITITVPAATGTPTPTYAVVGTPPTGISFNTGTRVISGTPETVGSGTIRIRASNSQGSDDWTVAYTITGPTLPAHGTIHWFVGFTMNDLLQAGTGSGTLTYGLEDLPNSLSFGSTTRRITGSPLIANVGTRELNYTVEDQYGNVASRHL